jgi:two-component system, response regulator, stage 0 sporulation protein A
LKVFIGDDSALVREGFQALLGEEEHVDIVGVAENGDQTVELVRRLSPDLVILDTHMPAINSAAGGLQALEQIKQMTPAPLVIVFTAFPSQASRSKCKELGADYYFDKAFDLKEIIKTLEILAAGFEKN